MLKALIERTQQLQDTVDRSREALLTLQRAYYEDKKTIGKLEQELQWAYSTISSLAPEDTESSCSAFPGVPVHTVDRRKAFFESKLSPAVERRNTNKGKKRVLGRLDPSVVDGIRQDTAKDTAKQKTSARLESSCAGNPNNIKEIVKESAVDSRFSISTSLKARTLSEEITASPKQLRISSAKESSSPNHSDSKNKSKKYRWRLTKTRSQPNIRKQVQLPASE